ncbi:Oxysterol-binding protein [Nemania abortiva]|nr:Oxysterol-binding protein [Nemania abortiva]
MSQLQTDFSQLRSFLSHLATIKGDLSNISAPPFLLSPISTTELPASWVSHPDLFLQPAREDSASRRALLVLKNFLCSLKSQLRAAGAPNKPLNAFLGELFIGETGTGQPTRVITEQASHHPPVTACAAYNRAAGISSIGYVAQETTFGPFSGVRVRQVGHAILRDERHGESHLRTPLPTVCVKGLVTGRARLELEGTCYVVSSSGYLSTVEFLGTGNAVRAEVRCVRKGEEGHGDGKKVFEVTGQWDGRLTTWECVTGTVVETFHVDEIPARELRVEPVEAQSPWESRRAWAGVYEGIRAGDMSRVRAEKNKIEEAQRQIREAERRANAEWPAVFFRRAKESPEFAILSRAIPDPEARELAPDRTAGVWEFVGFDAAEALIEEGIYHRALEPTGQRID